MWGIYELKISIYHNGDNLTTALNQKRLKPFKRIKPCAIAYLIRSHTQPLNSVYDTL